MDQSTVESMSRDIARDFAVFVKHRTFVHKTPANYGIIRLHQGGRMGNR